jgi:hypothetical protein
VFVKPAMHIIISNEFAGIVALLRSNQSTNSTDTKHTNTKMGNTILVKHPEIIQLDPLNSL